MPKQIVSGIDYAVNMINVMVEHDRAGAMRKWVDGIVSSWLVRMLETIQESNGNVKGIENLLPDGQKLIVRAIMSIERPEKRTVIFSTCLHHEIITIDLIPIQESQHVTIIGLD